VAEVASILKLNQQTIRNWIDAGKLPALHIGRRVRVKRSDFERLLEEGYRGVSPSADGSSAASIWDGEVAPPEVP
jgi:excisionase family DNA binding protein